MQGFADAKAPTQADDILVADDSSDRIYAEPKLDERLHSDLGRSIEPLTHQGLQMELG